MEEVFKNLNKFEYSQESDAPMVLCLGFFDCIHLGHMKIISRAKNIAYKLNAELSIFTFNNNPLSYFSDQKLIYTFDERCHIFSELEIQNVLYAEFSKEFSQLDKDEFLKLLLDNKKIKAIVVGSDYTFGRNKEGNVNYLSEYCHNNNILLYIEDLFLYNKEKLSSRNIRKLVQSGDINAINSVLSFPYLIKGKVVSGRGVGHVDLYPTANVILSEEKEKIKSGVYYTQVLINGVRYRAATSVGSKPTYGIDTYNVESYILFYNKSLYGKEIVIEFIERLRDNICFDSIEKLHEQIDKDILYICSQNGGYDD